MRNMESSVKSTITPVNFTMIPVLGEARNLTGPFAGGYDSLKKLIGEYFDEDFEHVAVLFDGHRRDMFVGGTSSINGRHIRNIRATEIYRANALSQDPDLDPEELPAISGPAVLFPSYIVWK
jgi:hypothetical protein